MQKLSAYNRLKAYNGYPAKYAVLILREHHKKKHRFKRLYLNKVIYPSVKARAEILIIYCC